MTTTSVPRTAPALRALAAVMMGLMCALTAAATPAQAIPCRNCGGGDDGGGSGPSDSPRYASYLLSPEALDGRLLPDSDKITTRVERGTPGQVQLRLHAAENVRWWKEIKMFGRSGNAIGQDYTVDDRKSTVVLTFTTADLDGAALVFSKAKFLGIHTGIYEVHNLARLDGQLREFEWIRDG